MQQPFDPEWPILAQKHMGEGISPSQLCGLPASPNFGDPYICTHCMKNGNQILHGDQTRWEEKFYRVKLKHVLAKIFVIQILTYDLLAVATLLIEQSVRHWSYLLYGSLWTTLKAIVKSSWLTFLWTGYVGLCFKLRSWWTFHVLYYNSLLMVWSYL